MNKKHKVLLIVIPFVVIIFGYVAYVEMSNDGPSEPLKADQVEKIYVKPNKTKEAYENKIAMKKSMTKVEEDLAREKKAVSDPSKFFDRATGKTEALEEEEGDVMIEDEPEDHELDVKSETRSHPRVVYVPIKEEKELEDEIVAEAKPTRRRKTGFSTSTSSSSSTSANNKGKNEIVAVVHRDIKAQTNDVVKLRILEDAFVDGQKIPANSIIDGIARVDANSGRVYLNVNGFSVDGNHVSQKFEAYSISGGKGLEVNIDLTKGAARSLVGDVVSNTGQRIAIPGVKSRTVTGAAEKKVEDPAADIPSGTKVFLR